MIDIKGLDKALVLAALYNRARPQGMGFLQYTPEDMPREEAEELLKTQATFDYLYGRVMKVSFAGDTKGARVMQLDRFMPWSDAIAGHPSIDTVVFPDVSGKWMAQVVPVRPGSFESRVRFPDELRGLRDAALAAKSGVEDAVFCHPGGFIAGAQSEEGACALAALCR